MYLQTSSQANYDRQTNGQKRQVISSGDENSNFRNLGSKTWSHFSFHDVSECWMGAILKGYHCWCNLWTAPYCFLVCVPCMLLQSSQLRCLMADNLINSQAINLRKHWSVCLHILQKWIKNHPPRTSKGNPQRSPPLPFSFEDSANWSTLKG